MRHDLLTRCALVLAVCIGVYWLMLGASPFAMSEAQRALPAWEMSDRREWLIPYLFDQPYLRKPPGVQWLIMCASEVFGRTEFAARVPSALCMTLGAIVSTLFAARWFGVRHSQYAGLAHALSPLYWYPGRAAEIESPHNFFVQLCVFASVDLLVRSSKSAWMGLAVGLGVFGALMTKGPAGIPCVVGAMVACVIVSRSWRTWGEPRWIAGMVVGVGSAATIGMLIAREAAKLDPVLQSPSAFLWDVSKLPEILTLGVVTIGAAFPGCLGLMAWFVGPRDENTRTIRSVIGTVLVALLMYTIVGVGNNRYAMPALTVSSVLMAPLVSALSMRTDQRSKFSIGAIHVTLSILVLGSFVHTGWSEARRERISGRNAGVAIASKLRDGEEVWSNQAIEYRAEVLYYAVREAGRRGVTVFPKWMPAPGKGSDAVPPSGLAAIVLMDESGVQGGARFETEAKTWPTVERALVHKYDVELRRAP